MASSWAVSAESLPPMTKRWLMRCPASVRVMAGRSPSVTLVRVEPRAAPGLRAMRAHALSDRPPRSTISPLLRPSAPRLAPYTFANAPLDSASSATP